MRRRRLRHLILALVLAGLFIWLWNPFTASVRQHSIGLDDFLNPWTAARLYDAGANPYDHAAQRLMQQSLDPLHSGFVEFWYLPWTLTLLAPFGLLGYMSARIAWFFVSAATILLSITLSWRAFAGRPQRDRLVHLVGIAFAPFILVLLAGQISAVVALGLAGFLFLELRGRHLPAGASLFLCTIKPHLVYLVFVALLLSEIGSRRYLLLAGFGLAGAGLTGIAVLLRPSVVAQFLSIRTAQYGPSYTVGGLLQSLTGQTWLQFAPMVVGLVWLVFYWLKRRAGWNWRKELPLLVLVSLATAPVSYVFDNCVAWVAVTAVLALANTTADRVKSLQVFAGYAVIDVLIVAVFIARLGHWYFIWVGPALLLWYALSRRLLRPSGAVTAAPVLDRPADVDARADDLPGELTDAGAF